MLDKGMELSDEKIYQLKQEFTRLRPTREQLQQMHDRFLRNNNYNDFSFFRFIEGAIPLYTQQQMEAHVDSEIRKLLRQAEHAVEVMQEKDKRLADLKRYIYLKELRREMEIRFYTRLEERKERERRRLMERLARVKIWLQVVDKELRHEAFRIASLTAEPTPAMLETAWSYGELLFDAVEQLMHRLPQGE